MDYLKEIYQNWASRDTTSGILFIEGRNFCEVFDFSFLIVTENKKNSWFIDSYLYEQKRIFLFIVSESQLEEWALGNSNRKIFEWLFNGKVIFDRNDYLHELIQELKDFPFYERKVKLGIEFARLICCYTDSKTFYRKKQYLDAYTHLIQSIHHLGRLAVIEKGLHPEITVWKQVKQIEPEIFKMYEELIHNHEQLSKRLELIFLASEFFIHKKTDLGSAHLLEILKTKEQWSLQEIVTHPEFRQYSLEIISLIEYLVDKNYINVNYDEKHYCEKRYFISRK